VSPSRPAGPPARPATPRPRPPVPRTREETAGEHRATGAPPAARPDPAQPAATRGGGKARPAPEPDAQRSARPAPRDRRREPSTGSTRRAPAGPRPGETTTTEPGRAVTTYTSAPAWRGPVRPAVVSDRSAERFAERVRARRTLARRQVAAVGGGLVALGAIGWLVLVSPVLRLDTDEVQVTGAGTVVAVDQVREVVARYADVPLPRIDTVALRDAVLDVPGVREARVVRDWPHGLDVVLVAREPVAAVPTKGSGGGAGKGYTLLDIDGVQVGRSDAAPRGLPVVSVPVGDRRTLDAVLTVLEQLPPELLEQVKDVSARTQDTVTMKLRDGTTVSWGSSAQTPLKVAVLQTLRSAPQTKKSKLVDVSAPTLPMTK